MGSLVNGKDYSNHEEALREQKEAEEEEDKYKIQIEKEKIAYKVGVFQIIAICYYHRIILLCTTAL